MARSAAKPKEKAVRNRWAGQCDCGHKVAAGAGVAVLDAGTWKVRCAECNGTKIEPMTPQRRRELLAAQKALCESRGSPHFAPLDGRCYYCKGDIVAALGDEYATRGVTGCPICSYSYCE